VAAILDIQNGRRYGQVQFVNEVVDYITTAEGRQPCYDLLETLQARQESIANSASSTTSVTLGNVRGIPEQLQGRTFEIVDGESDAEKLDRQWRKATYLKPQEAAALLRVDGRTVKRWAQQGKLDGFRTPGGHWRIDEEAVRRMLHGRGPMTTDVAVAEIDLGPCAVCGAPMLAGDEYVSVIETSANGTITKVSNRHAACAPTPSAEE
jgi:excisionase family DNA binding protein